MSKEPFTIQMDRLVLVMGRDVVDDLGRQIHAHDPSLPTDIEGQLREMLARPARSPEPTATIALEALDYVASLRKVLACLPSADAIDAAVREALGREPTAEECAAILAVIDELSRSFVRALAPRIAVDPPSIMPPHEPPPPPPTKARACQSRYAGRSCALVSDHEGACYFWGTT